MKIAVVGSGISGLGAALALAPTAEVQVFERDTRLGGHANTVEARFGDTVQPVDTGFIVYNTQNYPNLTALFEHLDVPTKWSDMSFGFSLGAGRFEYACDNLDKIFAQRWRALDPRYIQMVRQILRFCRVAPQDLASGALDGLSLTDWLDQRGFSRWFRERFLLPMGGAIWSTSVQDILDFPARNFVAFFANHDLMTGLAPAQRWRTVDGGSREYVQRLLAALGPRVHPGQEVVRVETGAGRPALVFADGERAVFDQVILACHAPQALALLGAPDDQQRRLLGACRTSENRAVLHSDPRLMPRRRRVWSSWNFLTDAPGVSARPAQVSYWMNRLQSIPEERPLFVSLNPAIEPKPELVHAEIGYAHPLFDQAAFSAQPEIDTLQGRGGVWYAGAWLGYGFHEDGLRSGLRVATALGARPVWARDTGAPLAFDHVA
ncbi:MAG: FAD-dependent oxidoreductase [Pseudomonadota bacterium]